MFYQVLYMHSCIKNSHTSRSHSVCNTHEDCYQYMDGHDLTTSETDPQLETREEVAAHVEYV